MHAGLVQAGDTNAVADLLQLRGLTDRMDSDLFLPFTGDELTGSLGTRVLQLCQIVDRTVERMAASGLADTRNCRSSGGKHGVYSQYFRLGVAGCRVYFTPEGWSKHGHPLGLEIRRRPVEAVRRDQRQARRRSPCGSRSGTRPTSTGRGSPWRFSPASNSMKSSTTSSARSARWPTSSQADRLERRPFSTDRRGEKSESLYDRIQICLYCPA
jgi:hypothetical protein